MTTTTIEQRPLQRWLLWWHYSRRERRLVYLVAASVFIETIWFIYAAFEMNNTGPLLGVSFGHAPLASCNAGATICASSFKAPPPFVSPITGLVIYLFPAVCAVAFIAPSLARELESKSVRFSWTQAVTRYQWLSSRSIAALGSALVVSAIGEIELHRWIFPHFYQASPPWSMFAVSGATGIGIALFLAAASIVAALLVKRPVAVVIIAALLYGAVLLAVSTIYPYALTPKTALTPSALVSVPQGAEYVNSGIVTSSGSRVSQSYATQVSQACSKAVLAGQASGSGAQVNLIGPQRQQAYSACLVSHGLYLQTSYQPEYRYWELQWIFAATALALTAAAVAGAFFLVKKMEV